MSNISVNNGCCHPDILFRCLCVPFSVSCRVLSSGVEPDYGRGLEKVSFVMQLFFLFFSLPALGTLSGPSPGHKFTPYPLIITSQQSQIAFFFKATIENGCCLDYGSAAKSVLAGLDTSSSDNM